MDGDTCDWKNDGNDWQREWTVEDAQLCLTVRRPSKDQGRTSWLPVRGVTKAAPTARDINARFSSPPVPADLGLKCVTFAYSVDMGRRRIPLTRSSSPTPSVQANGGLSLLQRQEGCIAWFRRH